MLRAHMCFRSTGTLLTRCGLWCSPWSTSSGVKRGRSMESEIPERTNIDQIPDHVDMPASTAWPIVLAFGAALVFAGLLTSATVSILGAVLMVSGCVGWFREVLPHEKHESIPVLEQVSPVATSCPRVTRVTWMEKELPRARLPLEIYPISAGLKGGLAGSVVMAIL